MSEEVPQENSSTSTDQSVRDRIDQITRDMWARIEESPESPALARQRIQSENAGRAIPIMRRGSSTREGRLEREEMEAGGLSVEEIEALQQEAWTAPLAAPDPVPTAPAIGEPTSNSEIPDYRSSSSPPRGWRPSAEELERLISTGAGGRGVPTDSRDAWRRGRIQANREHFSTNPLTRQAMSQAVQGIESGHDIGETARQVVASIPARRLVSGNREVNDTDAWATALHAKYYSQIIHENGWESPVLGGSITQSQLDSAAREAERRTHIGLAKIMSSGQGLIYSDPQDRNRTDELATLWGPFQIIGAYMSPMAYGTMEGLPEDPEPGERANFRQNRMQWNRENLSFSMGRMMLGSYLTTAGSTGEWFGPETIHEIRSGDDILYHTPEMIGAFSRLLGDEPGETSFGAKVGGVTAIGFATLLSPDIVTMAGSLLSAGTRLPLIAGRRLTRMQNVERALDGILERAAQTKPAALLPGEVAPAIPRLVPAENADRLQGAIGQIDISTQRLIGESAAAKFNTNAAGVGYRVDRLTSGIRAAENAVVKAKEALRKSAEFRGTAETNLSNISAVRDLNRAELELARMVEVEAEARKNITLELLGFPKETAARITTQKEYLEALAPGLRGEAEGVLREAQEAFTTLSAKYYNAELLTNPSAEAFLGDQLSLRSRELADLVSAGKPGRKLGEQGERLLKEIDDLRGQIGDDAARLAALDNAVGHAQARINRLDDAPLSVTQFFNARVNTAARAGLVVRAESRIGPKELALAKAREVTAVREAKILHKEQEAAYRIGARGGFVESIEEVRDSFTKLRTLISEELRVGTDLLTEARALGHIKGTPKRIQRYGQLVRGTFKRSEEQIRDLGLRIDVQAVEKDFQALEKSFVTAIGKDGKVALDRVAIQDYIARTLGKDTQRVLARFDTKGLLRRTISGTGASADELLSPEVWSNVKTVLSQVHQNRAYQMVERQDTLWARAIATAWKDLGILSPSAQRSLILRKSRNIRRWLAEKDAHTSFETKFGTPLDKSVTDIIRATENAIGRFKRELSEVPHLPVFGAREIWRPVNYIDSKGGIVLKSGRTRFAEIFNSGTIFDNGKRQILADTRINPMGASDIGESAVNQHAKLVKSLKKALKELELPKKELDELFLSTEKISEDIAEFMLRPKAAVRDLAQTSIAKPLLTLSRMFLSNSTAGPLSGMQQALLLIQARKALSKANTFGQFVVSMEKATWRTLGSSRSISIEKASLAAVSKAFGNGASAIGAGAALGYSAQRMSRLYRAEMTAETAADVNRIISGEGGVKNVSEALEAMNNLGINALVTYGAPRKALEGATGNMTRLTKELIEVGTDTGGTTFFPKMLVDAFEAEFGKVINSIEAVTPLSSGGILDIGVRAYQTQLALWRQSVVTGMIIPNPRYWGNNAIADAFQIYQEAGVALSVRLTLRNLPVNSPGHAFWSRKKEAIMAAAVRNKYGDVPVLPGIVESLFDPDVNKIFMGRNGYFLTSDGRQITFKQTRKWALEDGILEDFVHEELLLTLKHQEESFLGGAFSKLNTNRLNGIISDHAGTVQQRQRLGMYFALLESGSTRAEAKKRTLRALYDWKHGIAKEELKVMSAIAPFYRFWKLAVRQAAGALTEPWVRAPSESLKASLTGNTRLKRMQNQILLAGHAGDLMDPELEEDIYDEMRQIQLYARSLTPSHYEGRVLPSIGEMTFEEQYDYRVETGTNRTHWARVTPPITASAALNMLFGIGASLNMITAMLDGDGPPTGSDIGMDLAGDWESTFMEPFLGAAHPLIDTSARQLLTYFGADLDYSLKSADKTLNATEEEVYRVLKSSPLGMFFPELTPTERGRYQIPVSTYTLWKLLPFIGTQPTRWMAGWQAAKREDDPGTAFIEGLGALTGVYDKKYFNPAEEMDSILYSQFEQYQKIINAFPIYPAGTRHGLPDIEFDSEDEAE